MQLLRHRSDWSGHGIPAKGIGTLFEEETVRLPEYKNKCIRIGGSRAVQLSSSLMRSPGISDLPVANGHVRPFLTEH
jgi:hypothetical protein